MPNHFHAVCQHENLSRIISDFKKITAKQIIKQLENDKKDLVLAQFSRLKKKFKTESTYQVWQEGFHPLEINNQKIFNQKVEYIHFNPVRKGLVKNAEDWKYSSAGHYIKGQDSLIQIDKL
ncbi:MAG: transposase [Ignavibacteria bacterium]|nr:transposase [Ignavibacteria bacterium]